MLLTVPWLHRIRDCAFFAADGRSSPLAVPVYGVFDRHEIATPPGFSSYRQGEPVSPGCEWA